ncbi:GNAT family N-acetyltransferase [Sporosarcina sp. FSL K6-1522]|uniref:GNAT family N-acetyltransferase n=1 Tax=Sporosarcina sp. FSL K6-1522 TaxID=2921554 RepID=UPI00315AF568
MLGLDKGEIKLVSHADEWGVLFEEEQALLETLIGEHIVAVQHIGSTAITGISAKPLLDVLVGVRSLEDVRRFDKRKLKGAGYYHLGRIEIDGKVVFAKFSNVEELTKTHVLHVVEYGGDWWHKHTFFRDYLNEHPDVARTYEVLKSELAVAYPDNESAYTDGKKHFVDEVLRLGEMRPFIIKKGALFVRKLEDADKYSLAKWLSDPEVLRYYEGRDNPFDVEKVEEEYFAEDDVTRCLIEFEGKPIGYVQFYEVDAEERVLYEYGDSEELIYGMDQFIGESAYVNKGIGTKLIELVIDYLLEEKGADCIVMDPQAENERAIRCYEKCGFAKVKLLPRNEWHEGEYRDCWLIEYRRK